MERYKKETNKNPNIFTASSPPTQNEGNKHLFKNTGTQSLAKSKNPEFEKKSQPPFSERKQSEKISKQVDLSLLWEDFNQDAIDVLEKKIEKE